MQVGYNGYNVTIFEEKDRIGGMLQYGIPDFRLPKTILDRYKARLLELGVHIRPHVVMGGDLMIEWDRDTNHVYMTGPAVTVFTGEI